MKSYYVYILTNKKQGTLYLGITNNLIRRIYEHKQGCVDGFSKKYKTNQLVYFEETSDVDSAIQREKQMKKWYRSWKIKLIEQNNPEWKDLYKDLL